jgi:hypothetical protein
MDEPAEKMDDSTEDEPPNHALVNPDKYRKMYIFGNKTQGQEAKAFLGFLGPNDEVGFFSVLSC